MDRTIGKSQNRNYDGERLMKILESYKKMMNEFIGEAKITAKRDKISDRPGEKAPYKTSGGYWAGKHKGEIEYFDDKEKAQNYIKYGHEDDNEPGAATQDKPEPGKLSGKSDFDRDANRAADDEADDMDRDARFAADAEDDKPKDLAGSIEGDERAGQLANDIVQGADPDAAHKELSDMGHGDLANQLYGLWNNDDEEGAARLIAKATGNEPYEETININGKKYREVKEDRADGKKLVGYRFAGKVYKNKDDAPVSDPTPVYESKKPKKHILKENYERFFGDR